MLGSLALASMVTAGVSAGTGTLVLLWRRATRSDEIGPRNTELGLG